MESLYVLIPLSVLLVLAILAVLGWAINRGQFDDIEAEGHRILKAGDENSPAKVEAHQE
jgi:cbb3-type cytochrome oxidase maturation protein